MDIWWQHPAHAMLHSPLAFDDAFEPQQQFAPPEQQVSPSCETAATKSGISR
jgi:hypothetical protein